MMTDIIIKGGKRRGDKQPAKVGKCGDCAHYENKFDNYGACNYQTLCGYDSSGLIHYFNTRVMLHEPCAINAFTPKQPTLKACPFCGGGEVDAVNVDGVFADGSFWYVWCWRCEAKAEACERKSIAIECWNQRAAPDNDELIAWLKRELIKNETFGALWENGHDNAIEKVIEHLKGGG